MKNFLENEFISYYSRKFINIVIIFIVITSCLNSNYIYANAENESVPAILVFGDSVVDPGNTNYIITPARANFPPYGRDFPGGVATGRYSNGKIPSDLFAEMLGIKEFVPPYLDPSLQISDLLTGVSFAVGGCGYDPKSAKISNTFSLDDQLKYFKEYINKLKAAVGENTTSTIISQSVYLICSGSNDITNIYYTIPFARLQYNISTYTGLMVNWASTFVQELYALGARRIGVINVPPSGCLPAVRTLYGGPLRACAEKINQASIMFNTKLNVELNSLNQKLLGSKMVYLDVYNPLLNLINNPSQSGFKVATEGCCGTGYIEVILLCNRFDVGTCKDATKYVFWDSFHPTEVAYRFLVNEIYKKSFSQFF